MTKNILAKVLLVVDLRNDFVQALRGKIGICRGILQRADGQALSK